METTALICTKCRHADVGADNLPCRNCTRINSPEDYFEPADGESWPTNGDEIRGKSDNGLARFLRDKLKITCGNCPAEAFCIIHYPKCNKECLETITEWLKQEAVK